MPTHVCCGVMCVGCAALPPFPLCPLKADIWMIAGVRRCGPFPDIMELRLFGTVIGAIAGTLAFTDLDRAAFALRSRDLLKQLEREAGTFGWVLGPPFVLMIYGAWNRGSR